MYKYPKVYALGHKYISDIFDDAVLVEEKIDGSQINFTLTFSGDLKIFSRTTLINDLNPDALFSEGVKAIFAIKDKLRPEYSYHGEYLKKPKHNTLSYGRIPTNHIIIFDIENDFGVPLTYEQKKLEAQRLGFETVPLLAHKKIDDIKELFDLLDTPSILGNEKIEGVVVKNYNKYTSFNHYYIGKYVSERFKERNTVDWKDRNPTNKSIIDKLINELKTEARWYKAVQHLKESGKFTGDTKDIGEIFKLVALDIEEEEREYIKDVLYNHFIKDIKKEVSKGIPEWYKKKLAENSL